MNTEFSEIDFKNINVTIQPLNIFALLDLSQDFNGQISARVQIPNTLDFPPHDHVSILSNDENPKVILERCYVTNSKFKVTDQSATWELIVPTSSIECRNIHEGEKIKVSYSLSGINYFPQEGGADKFNAGGYKWTLELYHDHMTTTNLLEESGYNRVTASISVQNTSLNEIPVLDEIIRNLKFLFSFALGGEVQLARQTIYDSKDRPIKITAYSIYKVEPFNLGPIWLDGPFPGLATRYIECCYNNYIEAKQPYLLISVIRVINLVRSMNIVNVKALLASNALEILRYNYLHNVLVPAGRAIIQDFDGYLPHGTGRKSKRMTFSEILQILSHDLGITRWTDDFKDLRDMVVHSGKVPGAMPMEKYNNTMNVLHFCDTVVLSLLNWDSIGGSYIPCNQPVDPNPGVHGNNYIPFTR